MQMFLNLQAIGTTFFRGKFFQIPRASLQIPRLTAANYINEFSMAPETTQNYTAFAATERYCLSAK